MAFKLSPQVPTAPEPVRATSTDARDDDTADKWVQRLPGMIRLTGRHPFNAEPHTKELVDAGFITPAAMHYVRNHGPVPKLAWDDHRITVTGLGVAEPQVLSMDELVALPNRTLPVTLVCAGNRRKEVNVTRQSKGFSWGSGAVSTSIWTGVPLHVLLRHCGVDPDALEPGQYWVNFDGPDGELPKGIYGTSIPLLKALDPAQDVLVAFKQNHERLLPDHGFPVRLIIPGYIGGRMIKWLTRITISRQESQSFYHFHDNRVLPSSVDQERADNEGWWRKPEYIINDLNLNSAITHPTHDEEIPLKKGTYKLQGYAYCGGGRQVQRMEVSLDDGKSWELAQLSSEEYPTEHGRFWCWRIWNLDVDILRLVGCTNVACRAWDNSQNTQPRDLTWNVLGMMNNSWFRLTTAVSLNDRQQPVVRIKHPAPIAPGGWMEAGADETVNVQAKTTGTGSGRSHVEDKSVPSIAQRKDLSVITREELARHNSKTDCWIAVKGQVYDVTPYLQEHPGGVAAIVMNAGKDATEDFEAIHSKRAWAMLDEYLVGTLGASLTSSSPEASAIAAPKEAAVALQGKNRAIKCKLVFKEYESPDVLRIRFGLPQPDQPLGLPVGMHIGLRAVINGESTKRQYTPVSDGDAKGHVELLVKVYRANQHPRFPDGGLMSQHLDRMSLGDCIDIDGPLGHITYEGPGCIRQLGEDVHVKHFVAVAGGTGITPVVQVLRAVLENPCDTTRFSLIYAARVPEDLLLREELDAWAEQYEQFTVHYTVDVPPPDWPYSVGFLTAEMLAANFPEATKDMGALICGPPPMVNFAVKPNLEKLGYTEDQFFIF
ncbi:nitrate reductase [Nannochloropsis oceanica]|uniref:Nitrate reductase n=1 Tax=Nannochloropsis oceanica TaxID=145522 RepID=A0A7I6W612_9STRA|nr:Nitrate reductase [Nannochloropsis oceanica]